MAILEEDTDDEIDELKVDEDCCIDVELLIVLEENPEEVLDVWLDAELMTVLEETLNEPPDIELVRALNVLWVLVAEEGKHSDIKAS